MAGGEMAPRLSGHAVTVVTSCSSFISSSILQALVCYVRRRPSDACYLILTDVTTIRSLRLLAAVSA